MEVKDLKKKGRSFMTHFSVQEEHDITKFVIEKCGENVSCKSERKSISG